MTIYRFEKLISFIPAYSTIFIIIVTYIKLAKNKSSTVKYVPLFIMVFPLLLVLSYLYDELLINYTEMKRKRNLPYRQSILSEISACTSQRFSVSTTPF